VPGRRADRFEDLMTLNEQGVNQPVMDAALRTYPLTRLAPGVGLFAGSLLWLFSGSALDGLAVFTLLICLGLTWRRDEAPVFPFILFYQWVAVVIGHFYEEWIGPLPQRYAPGDVDKTILVSLIGLIVLAVGMRIGAGRRGRVRSPSDQTVGDTRARLLFWTVLALYSIDYFFLINTKEFGAGDQILQAALSFRQLFLMALWYEVLAGRGPMMYLVVTFGWVFLPTLGNYFSTFKTPVFLLFFTAASFWRPWDKRWWSESAPKLVSLIPLAVGVLLLAVVWQSGVKKATRTAYDQGALNSKLENKLDFFRNEAEETMPSVWEDPAGAIEVLVARLSYVTFFSRVLEFTPRHEPFAHGELLQMALTNAFVPRVLDPDKPILPSDSYYTRRFAGVDVAEGMTSISIGYMAEFYADWGFTGMFISILGYGLLMGLVHRGVRRFVRPAFLIDGAIATIFLAVAEFEHQFIKGFAAINIGFLVAVALSLAVRPLLKRLLAGVQTVYIPRTTPRPLEPMGGRPPRLL
jgi:hypothetical protein